MKTAFVFTIGDVFAIAFIILCVVIGALFGLRAAIRQAFCSHKNYYEPTIFHGYKCTECGKDFGYGDPRKTK